MGQRSRFVIALPFLVLAATTLRAQPPHSDNAHGAGTIRAVAKKLGVHRRMVRQALASSIPRERKLAARNKPSLGPVMEFIDEILREDQMAPRKQRHTAHRIWERIRRERLGHRGGSDRAPLCAGRQAKVRTFFTGNLCKNR